MRNLFILSLAALMVVTVSCKKDKLVTVTTGETDFIWTTGANLKGSFSAGKKASVSECGVFVRGEYGHGEESRQFSSEIVEGNFFAFATDLLDGYKYSYTAYAIVDGELILGEKKYFRTFSETGWHQYCTAIDLGDDVVWGDCNVGALAAGDRGGYFAWGERDGSKSDYSEETYTASDVTALDMDNDAAATSLGGYWRMPTKEELRALKEKHSPQWKNNYGGITDRNGLLFSGTTQSGQQSSLFLRAAGRKYPNDTGLLGDGIVCAYLSTSLKEEDASKVWCLTYQHPAYPSPNLMDEARFWGHSIVPVADRDKWLYIQSLL